MSRPWHLSRRRMLRGAGAAIALPFLEQMLPSLSRAQTATSAPRRLVGLFIPCGVNMKTWKPATTGAAYTLPAALQPLAPVRDDVLILSNLANRPAKATTAGEHPSGTGSFLTATACTTGSTLGNAVSVDQVAAAHLKAFTRIPSLELGPPSMEGTSGDCQGYSCTYMYNISWISPSTPAARQVNPAAVFDRLFTAGGTVTGDTAAQQRLRLRASVLDAVKTDTLAVQRLLGTSDRAKLDEYLTGVRELELRIQSLSTDSASATCTFPPKPTVSVDDVPKYVRAMLDLIVLAFQCDLTRVATLMVKAGGDRRDYPFPWLGIPDVHHGLSHHQGDPAKLAKLTNIDHWHVGELAYLLTRLKAIQEPDGTVLDNSVVFMSSEVSDGDRHNHDDLPVLLGGRGGKCLQSGRHVLFPTEQPLANLFTTMLQCVDVPNARFGQDGTGALL